VTTTDRGSSRDRLLDAASELFYRKGAGIGVEALCQAAGVSKRSMYQLFGSKDELMAASLERRGPAYLALLMMEDETGSPRGTILRVFERLEELAGRPDYRGCPLVATAIEVKDPDHPASEVARRRKQEMTTFFQRQAERGDARDPETLAQQLTMVFDGASARAVVRAEPLKGLAVTTATALLDAAGMTGQ
jgi:AcrR family transcriptional regulator